MTLSNSILLLPRCTSVVQTEAERRRSLKKVLHIRKATLYRFCPTPEQLVQWPAQNILKLAKDLK